MRRVGLSALVELLVIGDCGIFPTPLFNKTHAWFVLYSRRAVYIVAVADLVASLRYWTHGQSVGPMCKFSATHRSSLGRRWRWLREENGEVCVAVAPAIRTAGILT